jgi:hypothetical protein
VEGICLTAAEDICWTTVVTACLRSEVGQAYTGVASAACRYSEREVARALRGIGAIKASVGKDGRGSSLPGRTSLARTLSQASDVVGLAYF